jgi:hypothetical protein
MESHQETETTANETQYPPIRKQDGIWARNEEEKAKTFATHLFKVYKLY